MVERFDRVRTNGVVSRVHQEDMCQALAIQPTRKYESDGGPGVTDVATILARHSANAMLDLARFAEANVLSWLIAAPDAHAKNYGLLHAGLMPSPVVIGARSPVRWVFRLTRS